MPKATKNIAEKKPAKKSRPLRWLIVAGAVVAVGIILASGGLVTAIQLENHNAFCASCHTEPESQYYQRSLAAPVDLASAHNAKNVTCIQCHSGPGTMGRVDAIASVAAPDTFAFYSGHYRKPATITVPLGDEHCLKCHADVSNSQDFNNHFHAFLPRWQAADPKNAATCVECHQGHNTNGRADIAYLEEATTVAVCQRCHSTLRGE
jgi:predicted CXXCH cytochrome family protein